MVSPTRLQADDVLRFAATDLFSPFTLRDVLRFFTALLRHVDLGHLRNLGLRECASPPIAKQQKPKQKTKDDACVSF